MHSAVALSAGWIHVPFKFYGCFFVLAEYESGIPRIILSTLWSAMSQRTLFAPTTAHIGHFVGDRDGDRLTDCSDIRVQMYRQKLIISCVGCFGVEPGWHVYSNVNCLFVSSFLPSAALTPSSSALVVRVYNLHVDLATTNPDACSQQFFTLSCLGQSRWEKTLSPNNKADRLQSQGLSV